ncbi:MAG: sigma-E processing peptidase SpoIIGA [Lachnospiraceae bacterium]|nr:sigma-E processing peptidase SpoIIGA [Lachnospiraceae bacterium]MDE7029533.1 sigma-E processing peptidase SpoIIGA [Lachnospiraceae bacterium]
MIRIYEVYIDVFLAQNVLMDVQLLILTLLLLREKIVVLRLLAASLTGGAGALLILMSGVGYGITYILMVLVLDAVMLFICIRQPIRQGKTFQRLALGIIYLHGMVFAYGKLMECARRLAGERLAQFIVTAVIAGIVIFMLACRSLMQPRHIYEVVLTEEGENAVYRALLDTGNFLTDPVTGKPVSVVEETEQVKGWLDRYPQKYKIIPYQSVGREHGILEGLVVDQLTIQREKEQVVERGAVIALYRGKLSKDGAFQMILNHSLMKC